MQKMLYSLSYVTSLIHAAGHQRTDYEVDDESIDFTIKGSGFKNARIENPRIDVQLKCTSQDILNKDDVISFGLKIKNYKDLNTMDVIVPKILIVVFVPKIQEEWIENREHQHIILKYYSYWTSLYGKILPDLSDNTDKITIHIDKKNVLDCETVCSLLKATSQGDIDLSKIGGAK